MPISLIKSILFASLLSATSVSGQDFIPTIAGETQNSEGEIRIFCKPDILRLDSLKQLRPTLSNGYRVQIFFGKREEAQEKRAAFLRQHTEMGAYISYLAPNFRLRVGDFRNRIEAEKFKQAIASQFPGAYLVKDKIELPPLKVQ